MKKILWSSLLCLLCLLLYLPSYAGPKWEIGDDGWMSLAFLGQAHYLHLDNQAYENDFYLRRARIILSGQMMDGVKFFAETDNDNAGKYGSSSVRTDIQDAFFDVRIGKTAHWVQGGLILLPFSLENKASAASLLGIDYNAETIKLTNDFVWRDNGLALHGNFGKNFSYQMGVFDGYEDGTNKNDNARLRFTGHINLNIIGEAETGWFYTQDKLGKKGNFLTLGAGYDNQHNATDINGVEEDSRAAVADCQIGFGLGELACGPADLTVNAAFYDWDSEEFRGHTSFVETGLRISKVMLTWKYSNVDQDEKERIEDYTYGLHYFIKGHNARAGIELRSGDSEDQALVGVQFFL